MIRMQQPQPNLVQPCLLNVISLHTIVWTSVACREVMLWFVGFSRLPLTKSHKTIDPLVICYITMVKITMLFMGKSTISVAIFNSYFDITRGYLLVDPHLSWGWSAAAWRFYLRSVERERLWYNGEDPWQKPSLEIRHCICPSYFTTYRSHIFTFNLLYIYICFYIDFIWVDPYRHVTNSCWVVCFCGVQETGIFCNRHLAQWMLQGVALVYCGA